MDLTLLAIVRDERRYLLEWLAYHRLIGFTNFLIYDNESTDGTGELLNRLKEKVLGDKLNVVYWDKASDKNLSTRQLLAYSHALRFTLRPENRDWVAPIDVDEFITFTEPYKNLPELIADETRELPDCGALLLNWKIYGPNGHTSYSPEPVMSRYTTHRPLNVHRSKYGKYLFHVPSTAALSTHFPVLLLHKYGLYPGHPQVVDCGLVQHSTEHRLSIHKTAWINHYFWKSEEECIERREKNRKQQSYTRAEADTLARGFPETDTTILRFLDRTVARMNEWKELAGIV